MKINLAGGVIVDDYGRMALLHRESESAWEMPGGKVEDEESPEETAVREIREELGVDVRLTAKLGEADFEDDDDTYHYAWYAMHVVRGHPGVMEPDTFDDLDYFDAEDLMSLSLSINMQLFLEKLHSGEVALGGQLGA